ncbi:MAG TPA: hypothetical protein VJI98_02135 [Candidatus Nanoarchaeia archaeon]|nr:hypothetical protein [Candidatus Nanoarchaeia archaeon]
MFQLPLYDLPSLGLNRRSRSFSVVTKYYEAELARLHGGPDLANLPKPLKEDPDDKNSKPAPREYVIKRKWYRQLAAAFNIDNRKWNILPIIEAYPTIQKPSAMFIKTPLELEQHVLAAYQIAYGYYVLAKKHSYSQFPFRFCGSAARNITLALLERGYVNATCVIDDLSDHAYTVLPFVLDWNNHQKGTILVDGTSDQLWFRWKKTVSSPPRNLVTVNFGLKWKYETDYEGGANLFPSRYLDVEAIKQSTDNLYYGDYKRDLITFLKESFSNPVRLNLS